MLGKTNLVAHFEHINEGQGSGKYIRSGERQDGGWDAEDEVPRFVDDTLRPGKLPLISRKGKLVQAHGSTFAAAGFPFIIECFQSLGSCAIPLVTDGCDEFPVCEKVFRRCSEVLLCSNTLQRREDVPCVLADLVLAVCHVSCLKKSKGSGLLRRLDIGRHVLS